MSQSQRSSRVVLTALLLATAATSGCSWFRNNELYAGPPESRPLEVPPPLDASTVASTGAPGSVTASDAGRAGAAAQAAVGFTMPGTREEVYPRVGELLAGVQGLEITSRAQLLGAYDVTLDGASFLVRVTPAAEGVSVAAVDARGLPASGDAPRRVIDTLRAALAR